jgi:hypothetical protein
MSVHEVRTESAPLRPRGFLPAGKFDHFRHPMTTTVIGINPFKAQNARAAQRFFRQFDHILQARMGSGVKFLGLGQTAGSRAEFAKIAENLRDAVRRKPEDLRLDRQRRKGPGDFLARGRADLAKGLRENVRWRELFEQPLIHLVKILSAADALGTAASISHNDILSNASTGLTTTGLAFAAAGKSHSFETPTSRSPRPRAKTISVAKGKNEMSRSSVIHKTLEKIFAVSGERRSSPQAASAFRFPHRCNVASLAGTPAEARGPTASAWPRLLVSRQDFRPRPRRPRPSRASGSKEKNDRINVFMPMTYTHRAAAQPFEKLAAECCEQLKAEWDRQRAKTKEEQQERTYER